MVRLIPSTVIEPFSAQYFATSAGAVTSKYNERALVDVLKVITPTTST